MRVKFEDLYRVSQQLENSNFLHSLPPHNPVYDKLIKEGLIVYVGRSQYDHRTYELAYKGMGWSLAVAKGLI